MRWLCAAQDRDRRRRCRGHYDLRRGRWSESYPETTGYIIPSFLALARARASDPLRERALRMADWSCEVQMPDGAVLSGLLGARPAPAVFNTGQALFGWLAAYEVSGESALRPLGRPSGAVAARQPGSRRGVAAQPVGDDDRPRADLQRALRLGARAYAAATLDQPAFGDAARRAGEWACAQQNEAGWFANNAFALGEVPLLHTISYALEGLLGLYAFTGERRFLDATERGLAPICALARDHALGGRLDERWQSTVAWRCPTGEAQIAVVLQRLQRLHDDRGYGASAQQLLAGLSPVQDSLGRRRPSAGGVPGSFPLWGSYMRFALPNWAAKFYLDALLLETMQIDDPAFAP